jgi:hypothetical protein
VEARIAAQAAEERVVLREERIVDEPAIDGDRSQRIARSVIPASA